MFTTSSKPTAKGMSKGWNRMGHLLPAHRLHPHRVRPPTIAPQPPPPHTPPPPPPPSRFLLPENRPTEPQLHMTLLYGAEFISVELAELYKKEAEEKGAAKRTREAQATKARKQSRLPTKKPPGGLFDVSGKPYRHLLVAKVMRALKEKNIKVNFPSLCAILKELFPDVSESVWTDKKEKRKILRMFNPEYYNRGRYTKLWTMVNKGKRATYQPHMDISIEDVEFPNDAQLQAVLDKLQLVPTPQSPDDHTEVDSAPGAAASDDSDSDSYDQNDSPSFSDVSDSASVYACESDSDSQA